MVRTSLGRPFASIAPGSEGARTAPVGVTKGMRNSSRSPLPPPWFRPAQSSLTGDLPSLPPGGPREDIDNWPDERIWKELPNRLGAPRSEEHTSELQSRQYL